MHYHYALRSPAGKASNNNSSLSLHDALPISQDAGHGVVDLRAAADGDAREQMRVVHVVRNEHGARRVGARDEAVAVGVLDRKSTRLNSSHVETSYAVFCLKKINWRNFIRICR